MFSLNKILLAISFTSLITMTGVFYWYYNSTQDTIAALTANNAKLELAIKTNEETIAALQRDYQVIATELNKINNEFAESRAQTRLLVDKLAEHDLGYLVYSKPGLVENIINNASDQSARCFELLSGAPLTEKERNAKDEKSFNNECPWLFSTLVP